jgi:hypothetical protein
MKGFLYDLQFMTDLSFSKRHIYLGRAVALIIAGFLERRPGFYLRIVYVEFVVNIVTLGQVFLARSSIFPSEYLFTSAPHSCLIHPPARYTILATDNEANNAETLTFVSWIVNQCSLSLSLSLRVTFHLQRGSLWEGRRQNASSRQGSQFTRCSYTVWKPWSIHGILGCSRTNRAEFLAARSYFLSQISFSSDPAAVLPFFKYVIPFLQ